MKRVVLAVRKSGDSYHEKAVPVVRKSYNSYHEKVVPAVRESRDSYHDNAVQAVGKSYLLSAVGAFRFLVRSLQHLLYRFC